MEIEWYNMDRQTDTQKSLIVVLPFTPQNCSKCGGAIYN